MPNADNKRNRIVQPTSENHKAISHNITDTHCYPWLEAQRRD